MIRERIRAFTLTPARLWSYSQRCPYAAIGYGLLLLGAALVARPLIVGAASAAILGGLWKIFVEPLREN
jgi:hypothetical protein